MSQTPENQIERDARHLMTAGELMMAVHVVARVVLERVCEEGFSARVSDWSEPRLVVETDQADDIEVIIEPTLEQLDGGAEGAPPTLDAIRVVLVGALTTVAVACSTDDWIARIMHAMSFIGGGAPAAKSRPREEVGLDVDVLDDALFVQDISADPEPPAPEDIADAMEARSASEVKDATRPVVLGPDATDADIVREALRKLGPTPTKSLLASVPGDFAERSRIGAAFALAMQVGDEHLFGDLNGLLQARIEHFASVSPTAKTGYLNGRLQARIEHFASVSPTAKTGHISTLLGAFTANGVVEKGDDQTWAELCDQYVSDLRDEIGDDAVDVAPEPMPEPDADGVLDLRGKRDALRPQRT